MHNCKVTEEQLQTFMSANGELSAEILRLTHENVELKQANADANHLIAESADEAQKFKERVDELEAQMVDDEMGYTIPPNHPDE